jgi:hypothetical protein
VIPLLRHVGHLTRRFAGSLSRRPPAAADEAWAASQLAAGEQALWGRMGNADRRHSIEVARRFVARRPRATRAEVAGALLHDCGKVEAGLGTVGRVVATVAGPRSSRFRAYHDHEAIGARLAQAAGSDPATVALIEGRGPAVADLLAADDV